MKYVLDTSIVIEGIASDEIKNNKIKGTILIPHQVVAELEHQANQGLEIGYLGLEELQKLQDLKKKKKISLEFIGERPTIDQIKLAKTGGEIDALIRQLAFEHKATLITADKVQAESARVFGLKVKFIEMEKPKIKTELEKLFDKNTMSLHIKEDCYVYAKKGMPGKWELKKLKKKLDTKEVQTIAKDIVEKTRMDKKSFIEISRRGSTILQYKNFRVVITKPPISDGWEITAIRPIKKLNLDDYNLDEKILNRIKERAQGILVAGETGSGKSTFAQAVAESYVKNNKITKTVESPRDLQLTDNITQYSKNFTSSEEIHDILFLSRPDNLIFDEIRDTPDFKLYIDLRLAGSSCLGVLHSASPVDAVQRFIGRLETGMIPSVLDTILYMESGKISKILTLRMLVKVPTGMTEQDLARPVIEVREFETDKLEYEIYSYGEETVVIPIESKREITGIEKLAIKQIEDELSKYGKINVEIVSQNKIILYAKPGKIPDIIGRAGSNIDYLERKLGLKIDVREMKVRKDPVNFHIEETKKNIVFQFDEKFVNKKADFYADNFFVLTAMVGYKGEIKINKKSEIGKKILFALDTEKKVEVLI